MLAMKLIKRTIQGIVLLGVLGFMGIGFLTAYVDGSPDAKARLEISERAAADRVDSESGIVTKLWTWAQEWWDADERVAEAKADKIRDSKSKAERRREEESRRFNEGDYYSSGDDYYGRTS
jgi:hypothetical protein